MSTATRPSRDLRCGRRGRAAAVATRAGDTAQHRAEVLSPVSRETGRRCAGARADAGPRPDLSATTVQAAVPTVPTAPSTGAAVGATGGEAAQPDLSHGVSRETAIGLGLDAAPEPKGHSDSVGARAAEEALAAVVSRETDDRDELASSLPTPATTPRWPRLSPLTRASASPDRAGLPQAGTHPGADRREPEGRRRQDHHHRQRGGRPGPGRLHGAGHRHRPAGQRQHRARHRPPRRGAEHLRRARRGHAAGRRGAGVPGHPRPVVRARDDRPGRRRDRAGLAGRPRDPAAQGHRGLPRRRASTPAGAGLRADRLPAQPGPADGQRLRRGAARCSSRSSASTTRWRGCRSC